MAPTKRTMSESSHRRSGKRIQTSSTTNYEEELMAYCDLEGIVSLMGILSTEKKKVVNSLGLGSLLMYTCTTLRSPMCVWMMDNFDPDSKTFNIHGRIIKFEPIHVQYILGFKAEGDIIVENEDEDWQPSNSLDFSSLNLRELSNLVVNLEACDVDFRRGLVLLVMTTFFAPRSSFKPKKSWLSIVKDVELLPMLNWGQFIFDNIIIALHKYKKNRRNAVGGCIFFFMILFCDYSINENLDDIWKYNLPRAAKWNDHKTETLHKHIMCKVGGYDCTQLMVKLEECKQMLKGEEKTIKGDDSRLKNIELNILSMIADISFIKTQIQSLNDVHVKIDAKCDLMLKTSNDLLRLFPYKGEKECLQKVEAPCSMPVHENVEEENVEVTSRQTKVKGQFVATNDTQGQNKIISDNDVVVVEKQDDSDETYAFEKKELPQKTPLKNIKRFLAHLNSDDRAICEYVFDNKNYDEILCQFEGNMPLDRRELQNLFPQRWISGHILDMVGMECKFNDATILYIRATVKNEPNYMFELNLRNVSHKLSSCSKILLPIHEVDHWYMVVVDMKVESATLLDSLPKTRFNKKRKDRLREQLQVIAKRLYQIVGHEPFKHIGDFMINTGNVNLQPNGFDCGVYVLRWLEDPTVECPFIADQSYNEEVAVYRLKTLVRLIRSKLNKKKNKVIENINSAY